MNRSADHERTVVEESDKNFWHRYTHFYEPYLASIAPGEALMEFGVFHGASIRYLRARYPSSRIVACDILSPEADWPRSDLITYVTLDQGEPHSLERLFELLPGPYGLVIEDGSHYPQHQKNCLMASITHLRDGGTYILEDLHTSHPGHPLAQEQVPGRVNCYHVLLAFEHLLATGDTIDDAVVKNLTSTSIFSGDELRYLFARVKSIDMYRRSLLPLRCYRCGGSDFSYAEQRCSCGVELFGAVDSISAVITTRNPG